MYQLVHYWSTHPQEQLRGKAFCGTEHKYGTHMLSTLTNMIRMLQEILGPPVSKVSDFDEKTLKELQSHTADLQDRLRNRRVS